VLTVRGFPVLGSVAAVALLTVLWATVGLSPAGWLVGLLCGVTLHVALALSLASRAGSHVPGPADLVTLTRAVIACAVAGLTAEALLHGLATAWFVPITVVALSLDAVDGWVARRSGTSSAFGSRFDGEVDAFLILVLSVYVTPTFGVWVLAAGLMRYVFGAAGWVMPWMRGPLTYRYWRKVVTATQGIVLAVAAAGVLPHWFSSVGLVVGLALLSESFGRDVRWLWHERAVARHAGDAAAVTSAVRPEPRTEAV
jgi:phosphatidylglycerophosphate synthase